jgi:hypothetical protein
MHRQIQTKRSGRAPFSIFLVIGLLFACLQLRAQSNLALTVIAPTNGIAVGGTFTYTLLVTNSVVGPLNAFVTNRFSGSPIMITAVGPVGVSNSVSTNTVIFNLPAIPPHTAVQLTVSVTPTNTGFFTNTITLVDASSGVPPFPTVSTTTLFNSATNFTISADLAVAIFWPSNAIYSNDWTSYRVSVTNFGPSAVTNVSLTITNPSSVGILSISPSNFNLGTLSNGASRTFTLRIQPTNSGSQSFSASVSAPNLVDSNPANNTAITNITVLSFLPASLTANNVTAMTNNPQTGLMNQVVRLSNTGGTSISSARLMLQGIASLAPGKTNRLYNASGTNNGNPFVVYGNTLNPSESVDLVLEYYTGFRQPISVDSSNYAAVAISAVTFNSGSGTNGSFAITTNYFLPNGSYLIEFQSIPGRSYTILYSSDMLFSTSLVAQPSIVAPANRVQWIDDGPPKTISRPISAGSRFYRVRQEP